MVNGAVKKADALLSITGCLEFRADPSFDRTVLAARLPTFEQSPLLSILPLIRRSPGNNAATRRKGAAFVLKISPQFASRALFRTALHGLGFGRAHVVKTVRPAGAFVFRAVRNRAPLPAARAPGLAFRSQLPAKVRVVTEVVAG